jgi:hypothetical protein
LKVDYRPETAPFNKNPTKAGGVFCFGGVGCSALRPAQGALTPPFRTKYPTLLLGIFYKNYELNILK